LKDRSNINKKLLQQKQAKNHEKNLSNKIKKDFIREHFQRFFKS